MQKNLYKAEFGYSWLSICDKYAIGGLTGYLMSYKGAAGKAFSAHMPTLN